MCYVKTWSKYHAWGEDCLCACHEGVHGSWGIAALILKLHARWAWVVSFTPNENTPGIRRTGGFVGLRASPRVLGKTFVITDLIWDLLTHEYRTDRLSRNVGK